MEADGREALEEEAAPTPAPKRARDLPFTKENILAIVSLHAAELQGCYEEAMAKRGSTTKDAPAGRVVMSWIITLQGIPSEVKVKKTEIGEGLLTDCMIETIRGWEFPRPERPQPVEFPFDLKAIGGNQTLIGEANQ